MISLTLSKFPFVIVMLGFTNILCMPFIQSLGVMPSVFVSIALTVVIFPLIVIYYLGKGLSYREVLETKFTSNMSGMGCLLGLGFFVIGIVIMTTASDAKRDKLDVEPNEIAAVDDAQKMTKYEQIFFGATFSLLGIGVGSMVGVGQRS